MYVKFTTCCRMSREENIHIIKVPDDATEEYLQEILEELIQEDVEPDGGFEELEPNKVDELIEDDVFIIDMTNEEE